jgi:hypothetical protein
MQVWLGQDGRVRGVVNLDAITSEEFEEAFGRWGPDLRRIDPDEVAGAVLEAVRPGVIAEVDRGGYQRVRFTLRPKSVRVVRPPPGLRQVVAVEAMPLLV